jgi:RHS repeat-associated protein
MLTCRARQGPPTAEDTIMTRYRWIANAILVICMLVAKSSYAQNDGTPSFGAQKSFGIDTIDLVSLTPEIRVPLYSKPGPLGIHPSFQIQPQCKLVPYWTGATYVTGIICNSLPHLWVNDDIYMFGGTRSQVGGCVSYSSFGLSFPDGLFYAARSFSGAPIYTTPGCGGTTAETIVALDDSGFQVNLSASSGVVNFTVYDSSGQKYQSGHMGDGVPPTSFADSYGNTQSWTNNGNFPTTYTDEYGVNSPTLTGTGITWLDANSNEQQVTYNNGPPTPLLTNFSANCLQHNESATITPLNSISYSDGSSFALSWESNGGNLTGRINGYTRREGGTVQYVYGGAQCNGIGSGKTASGALVPNTLTRTDADGTWSFSTVWGTNNIQTTTVLDPGMNKTVYTFTGSQISTPANPVVTEIQTFQNTGTVPSPAYSLLKTVIYCYNGQTSSCPSHVYPVGTPITERDIYVTLGSMSTSSRVQEIYDTYGNTISTARYDFGAGVPTFTTTTTYGTWNGSACVAIGNYVQNRPCDTRAYKGTSAGTLLSETRNTYDTHGGLLNSQKWTGSSWVTTSYTRNANGTIATKTPSYGTATTYGYAATGSGGCNQLLLTSTTTGSLGTSQTWNCNVAAVLSETDENGQVTTSTYNDPFFRLTSVTDALGNQTTSQYTSPTQTTATPPGGYGSTVTTTDGLGRIRDKQVQQGAGSGNYNTQSFDRHFSNGAWEELAITPCVTALGGQCSAGGGESYKAYDALNRVTGQVDALQLRSKTTMYTNQDVVSVLGPAPSGENTKSVQREVNGVGQLISSCSLLSSGGTACGQAVGGAGIVDTYAYAYSPGATTTTITRGAESKTLLVDGLGRRISWTTPERGTETFAYDGATSKCTTPYPGELVSVVTGVSTECITYDAYRRVVQQTYYVGSTAAHCSYFVFGDSSPTVPPGSGIAYSYGNDRVVNAYTSETCTGRSSPTIDEWYSYDKDGHMTTMWELTPQSGGYYKTAVTYDPRGTTTSVSGIPGMATQTLTLDSMGRVNGVKNGLVSETSGATFDAAGMLTSLTVGSQDSESFTLDKDERVNGWQYTVNGASQTGAITYNSNGTIEQVSIADHLSASGTQTCNYNASLTAGTGYDDVGRLIGVSCGSVWAQTYAFDQYDNIVESGSLSWSCAGCYNAKNQYTTALAPSIAYDGAGDLTSDSFNSYTWYPDQKLSGAISFGSALSCGTAGHCAWYDAYGRLVQSSDNSTYTEYLLSPMGTVALMSGQVTSQIRLAILGGTYRLVGSNAYFGFIDWLGSTRVAELINSSGGGTLESDVAVSPYGYVYDAYYATNAAKAFPSFIGMSQDIDPESGIYDTANRELPQTEARWLSPDPADSSWNAYAYLTNPMTESDPSGLGEGVTVHTGSKFCSAGIIKDCNFQQPSSVLDQLLLDLVTSVPGGVASDTADLGTALSTEAPNTASTAPDAANATGSQQQGEDQQQAQPDQQQQPTDNPSNLRLVPQQDDGHDQSDDRNIVYEVQTTSGDYPAGDWYVTEHQTNPNFNGTTNGMSGGNELNQFSDEIYPSPAADTKVGTKSTQTFTISPNQGLNAQPSYSIIIRIQGKDYGALGIYVIPGGSRVNGMLNLLKGQ